MFLPDEQNVGHAVHIRPAENEASGKNRMGYHIHMDMNMALLSLLQA